MVVTVKELVVQSKVIKFLLEMLMLMTCIIQAIGLRGGITTEPPNPDGEYPITGSTYISVLSIVYDSANNHV